MAKFKIALNMEFCRSADKSFEAGAKIAAELGYRYIEPRGTCTKTADGLLRIVRLVPSPWIGVNWDTGNSHLAGIQDPYEGLEKVRDCVRPVHAEDISLRRSAGERGKVTGTPVGCACGEGVVDWERVVKILQPLDREIFLSVECGKIDEPARSLTFLRKTPWAAIGSNNDVETKLRGADDFS